ncbi:conserved hypothetical protein [Perkinsus marinus ATCC 50983]|uniref:Ribosomal protein L15 n=1 Tax=Perkinsus marinus (strain ATCC 50983 / TXsc) TaxID=423536 RepID=C5LUB6_PERM5|nr:conserved hypothetical protein [Perkinsus marinus ATCC 50983]EEQ99649.1 conserved hypothetical protein [Perkinsus marinus ATCC 50983]|eukprot:XP_002766932.1 conserved hypothetical protein [Perkinsus marinus ATCC 50983]
MARFGVDALWDADMSSSSDGEEEETDDSPFHETKTMATGEWDKLLKGTVLDPSTITSTDGIDEDMLFEVGGEASGEEEEEEKPSKTKASGSPVVEEVFSGGGRAQPGAFTAYKPTYYDMVSDEVATTTTGSSLLGQWPKLRHPYLQQHLSFRPSFGVDARMAMPVESTLNRHRIKVLPSVLPPSPETVPAPFVEQCFSAFTSVEGSTVALELYDLYRSYEGSPNVQRRKSIFSLLSGMLEDDATEGDDDLRPWLSEINLPIPSGSDPLERAFHQLLATKVAEASRSLQAAGYPRLARIAAILGFDSADWESARSEGTVSLLKQQLAQWKLDSPGEFIKGNTVTAVYRLLAGEVHSEEVLSRCPTWTAKLAAYYCYGTKADGKRYSLVESIKAVGQGSGIEWELLRVRAGIATPDSLAESLLCCSTAEPFTAFLSYLTYTTIDADATLESLPAARLASVTAQWLESVGLWQWAALVYCEYLLVPSSSVQLLVTDLLYRNMPRPSDSFRRIVLSQPVDDQGTPVFCSREALLPQPVVAALSALMGEDDLNALLWSAAAPRFELHTRDSRLAGAVCYMNAGDWREAARVMDRELLTALEDVILGGDSPNSRMSGMVSRLAFLASGSTNSSSADPMKDWIHFANAVLQDDDVLTSTFIAKCKACNHLGIEKDALLREATVVDGEGTGHAELLQRFTPRPFNPRFAYTSRPFFPICAKNMRNGHGRQVQKKKKKRVRGRGKSQRGIKLQHDRGMDVDPETWDGGNRAYYTKFPKWPGAKREMSSKYQQLETLSLARLRKFIEYGRLDTRYPITQRHLFESRCVKRVRNGVRLFNYNDYPFPYKVDIEVASVDQSSIDMIKRVGGSVTVVYMERVALRAHIKPWKFEVLPKTARPNLAMVHYMEKMRARGAKVRYIKPLWLLDEEQRVRAQLREEMAEEDIAKETIPELNS